MNDQDAILEKLKKLLRMKRGGTPEEVATALRLAQKLADENGIDLGQVNPDADAAKPIGHEYTEPRARTSWEAKHAAQICAEFFNVRVTLSREIFSGTSRIRFVGTAVDRRVAMYVYHFLIGHFRREWATKKGRCRDRRAFMYGMRLGVSSKLRERQPAAEPTSPLAVARVAQGTAMDDYEAAHFPGRRTAVGLRPDSKAYAATHAGFKAGRATEIRQGVETTRAAALIG